MGIASEFRMPLPTGHINKCPQDSVRNTGVAVSTLSRRKQRLKEVKGFALNHATARAWNFVVAAGPRCEWYVCFMFVTGSNVVKASLTLST